ncbi:DUF6887 family protein [Nostoc sp. 'Lobaria pulmonaria (5183) cyanobiont']|uniref:DUF6887 family protein n=1 Tax=Nostoc sp. 'Lobaria pulmonaria (5183) cyanobiont' TaxID=1618022 RepID=UPI000D0C5DA1|nr:hypothetical protein [Nostoc sp. 'Lobaria pulmonaria (5183) cyanobiont']AVH73294.1 hypothetical protein NLP_4929 [Nostoc sp. 'Lobaria pulmonaria (5183) cyanobiont']
MTKPNFPQMPLEQLRTYILEHRNDDEAFHIYIDKRRAQVLGNSDFIRFSRFKFVALF